eukprot:m51a1_g5900 hypothetical protein (646) ;mRNA; r:558125-562755
MRVVVSVRDKTIAVHVGAGGQLLRWLAFVSCARYCEAAGLYRDELQPLYIGRRPSGPSGPSGPSSAPAGPPADSRALLRAGLVVLDPYRRVCDAAADGDALRVVPEGDALPEPLLLPDGAAEAAPAQPLDAAALKSVSRRRLALADAALAAEEEEEAAREAAGPRRRRRTWAVTEPYDYDDARAFARALAAILADRSYARHVGWSRTQRSLVVYDKEAFARDVMPRHLPYASADQLARNLERCGFVDSYPPPGEEAAPRYAGDRRLEFVAPFAPQAPDQGELSAVALYRQLGAARRQLEEREAAAGRTPAAAGEAGDRQVLGPMAEQLASGAAFTRALREQLCAEALLARDEPHEDAALLRLAVAGALPRLAAAFRHLCYARGEAPALMSMGDFVHAARALGLVAPGPPDTAAPGLSRAVSSLSVAAPPPDQQQPQQQQPVPPQEPGAAAAAEESAAGAGPGSVKPPAAAEAAAVGATTAGLAPVLSVKDAEMVYMEATARSAASAGAGDGARQMVFAEFLGALLRLAARYAERTTGGPQQREGGGAYRLSAVFESLVRAAVLPRADEWHRSDYGVLRALQVVAEREELGRAVAERAPRVRDAYYAAAAPDTRLTLDRMRAALVRAHQVVPQCYGTEAQGGSGGG